ncbi:hypothetical protein [Streptomyces avermitilis]|uniref:hypothetical protein n=1 Tax=Streptomyces avermitilis TaxID=33903 RepID=UPI00380C210C
MRKLEEQGLAATNGKLGKENSWNLTRRGQQTLTDGGELPLRPKAGAGADGVKAGFGPHGVAVTASRRMSAYLAELGTSRSARFPQ